MNTSIMQETLNLEQIRRVVDVRVTQEITDYSYPKDVCTLSNGMQVGRLSNNGTDSYSWACVLVGNLKLNPTGRYGKAALSRLYGCLSPEDCTTVARIAHKAQLDHVSSGKQSGWKLG